MSTPGLQDVLLHPLHERLAVAADAVPESVEVVVALGDPEAVGRVRPFGRRGDDVDHPARNHDAARARHQFIDEPLDESIGYLPAEKRGQEGHL